MRFCHPAGIPRNIMKKLPTSESTVAIDMSPNILYVR